MRDGDYDVRLRDMKISDPNSNWYVPPDWRLILSSHFVFIPIMILTSLFFTALGQATRGNPTLLWVALAIGVVGVILLFLARLPLYREKKFLTIGPKALPPGRRKLYWISYGFIGTSIAIMAMLLAVLTQ